MQMVRTRCLPLRVKVFLWDSQPGMSYVLSGPGMIDIDCVCVEFGL